MENTQYPNQDGLTPEAGVVGEKNSGDSLEKVSFEFNRQSPQSLMNLGSFLKNEIIKLQSLMVDLEAKKQKVERQVQINKDTLEKLSLVEKQAQEVISESIKVQKENEIIFQQNERPAAEVEQAFGTQGQKGSVSSAQREGNVGHGDDEPLTLQNIWR